MEKLTPQIAALYLGQKCETPDGVGVLSGWRESEFDLWFPAKVVFERSENHYALSAIKLILRPISSLTGAEWRELHEASFGEIGEEDVEDNDFLSFWKASARFEIFRCERLWGYSNRWLKLLSWGIDLFGLIESGIALDATKMEIEKNDG